MVKKKLETPRKKAIEIREDALKSIKLEKSNISRQWMAFKENLAAEDIRREHFIQSMIKEKNRVIPINIQKFIGSLKRAVRKTMRDKGGTCFSIIRDIFLYWDADRSGKISLTEMKGILKSLGIITTETEEKEIIEYYNNNHVDSVSEVHYKDLLDDIQRGEPTIISAVNPIEETARSSKEIHFEEINRSYGNSPKIVKYFIEALQNYITNKMRNDGGTPYSVCHDLMKTYDYDYSNGFNAKELQTLCIKAIKIQITLQQAQEIVNFYDLRKNGQMELDKFYPHISIGSQPLLHHVEKTPRTLALIRESLSKNPLIPKEYHPNPNKLLEKLKSDIKNYLEKKMKAVGGSLKSWIDEAFLFWDPKGYKYLTEINHIIGVCKRLGVEWANEEIANILLTSYNTNSNKHQKQMNYSIFVNELISNDPHFITDTTKILSNKHKMYIPDNIIQILNIIKNKLDKYIYKSKGILNPRDLLHGTFLRYDGTHTKSVSVSELKSICNDLHIPIRSDSLQLLVNWYDSNGNEKINYNQLIIDLYGDDITTKDIQLPTLNHNKSINMKPKTTSALLKSVHSNPSSTISSLKEKNKIEIIKAQNLMSIDSNKNQIVINTINRNKIINEKLKIEMKLNLIEEQRKKIIDSYKNKQSKKLSDNTASNSVDKSDTIASNK